MNGTVVKQAYKMIRDYAVSVGGIDEDSALVEVCDFGDSYGFLFEIDDKYANLYWCVEKEAHRPFPYRPNMDMEKYIKRKILQTDAVR